MSACRSNFATSSQSPRFFDCARLPRSGWSPNPSRWMDPLTKSQNPVALWARLGDINEESKLALIALAGGIERVSSFGLADIYGNLEKMTSYPPEFMRVYPLADGNYDGTHFVFLGGPAGIIVGHERNKEGKDDRKSLEAGWSLVGSCPLLMCGYEGCPLGLPFFPANVPIREAADSAWVDRMFRGGLRPCRGSAIISFYDEPYDDVIGLMQWLYGMGKGFRKMFAVGNTKPVPTNTAADPHAKYPNVQGIARYNFTQAERRAEVNYG